MNKEIVNTMIDIGTPIRPEFTVKARVGQHINVYNAEDRIQELGTGRIGTEEVITPIGIRIPVPRLVFPVTHIVTKELLMFRFNQMILLTFLNITASCTPVFAFGKTTYRGI